MQKRFIDKKEEYNNLYKSLEKKYNIISNIRFFLMALIIYFGYRIYNNFGKMFLALEIIAVILFLILVVYHQKIRIERKRAKILEDINGRYISRIDGTWTEFQDTGKEFIDTSHDYSNDLDIVGKNSIFQLLNITNTHTGRKIFINNLLKPHKDKEKIYLKQEAIKELSGKLDLVQEIEYLTYKNKKDLKDPETLIKYAESKENLFKSKFIKNLIRFMPVLVLGINISGIISGSLFIINIGVGVLIFQVLIWILSMFRNSKILETVNYLKYNLDTYLEVLKLLEKEDFSSKELIRIKGTMFPQGQSSIEAIKELDKITQIINIRSGGISNLILNALFLWDYQCIFLLEKWKEKYGERVKDWIEAIGEIESLISFSVLNNINSHIVLPKIADGKSKIIAEELGHPLINMEDRIDNDIELDNEIFIITGSNMSGKTTFLRTIGINLVLAYNGAGVCAKSMEISLLDIITSMRIVDDLKGGISTFYAEILRIKSIIDRAETQDNMIFLIDEIFTGTNSVDRILGAKNVIGNLNKDNIIGMITTHDLELCALDSRERIKNFYFEDKYDGKTIKFDYKIKSGKSTSTNAKNLMNLAGIKIIEDK
ncbi:MutS-related protein [Clostridiisalibacter paucivorans]|uniref:MutS-related protein n=1 Tax=Clostridiisalibacter paucivorans TaxID=408753 RepID=UPI00047A911F|nr:hypothetical protein [Clostridiisalibacter paucivorans]